MIRLAFDEGPGVGLGHRRRMEALGAALQAVGVPAEPCRLDGGGEGRGDGAVEGDVVVVDSYATRADDAERIRARRVVAVDDLDRDLAVDLVVDPAGVGGASAAGRVLRGLDHALLDPKLESASPPPASDDVQTVLVTTGGADVDGAGAQVAASLRVSLPAATSVRLVIGPWGTKRVPPGVEGVQGTDGLLDELAGADMVVTAAGVTLLEALVLGRPAVTFCTAANQQRYLDRLVERDAVVATAVWAAADAATELVADGSWRSRLVRTGPGVVDGRGARRVAEAVAELV